MDQFPTSAGPPRPRTARFDVHERIGEGAMGLVFRARDRETGLDVALKMLRGSDACDLRRLKAEFRALADLSHPNLVRLYDLDTTEEPAFFTMELVDGVPFDAFVRRGGPRGRVDFERLAEALWQLAQGLEALHRSGRLHRDIKPSNVLVEAVGRSVLLDFGMVASAEERRGRSNPGFAGTPAYMAPEQAWGLGETPRSDWFAVGVLLYECLTGRLPFGPAGAAAATAPPPPPRSLAPATPELLDALTMALLRPTPEARPAEGELLELLRRGPGSASTWFPPRTPPAAGELVGRDGELAALHDALDEAMRRGGVSIRVSGPSGIGKTALIERFTSEIEAASGTTVLRSRCRPQEAVAFAALDGVIDELARWLADEPPELLAAVAPAHSHALRRAFPVLRSLPFPAAAEPETDEPAALRRRAFEALRELLIRVAARRPLVIWVDDLQWGDEASAPLLRELMQGPRGAGLLLVLSYRSEDAGRSELLRAVEDAPGRRLALGPLPHRDACTLAARLLGAGGAERIDEIATESGGSPFFVAQLTHSVAARARDGDLASDDRVGLTVDTVVQEHLDRLEPRARALLEVVAVAGGSIERSFALRAAGLGERGRPLVFALQHECLLRVRERGRDPAIEVYHDRIREGVLDGLAAPVLRERHRALASTLEAGDTADAETLMRHCHGAGDLARAGTYAAIAADRAAEALRFERAAALYALALDWAPGPAERQRRLRTRRADALVDAGRCAEAAPLYLEAAQDAPRAEALELRRRGVEQLLVCGQIDEGTRALRPLLRELGLRLPDSPRAALLGTLAQLARLAARRTRFAARAEQEVAIEALTRIDLCYAAARGLLAVDTIRGAYLPSVGLLLALGAGEPGRVGRCLAAVGGGVLAPLPGRLSRWGERMLAEARRIAAEHDDRYLAGAIEVVSGQRSVVRGAWLDAVEHSAAGLRILEAYGRGARWEQNVAYSGLARGLEELGRLHEAARHAALLIERSRGLGDLYGEMVGTLAAGVTDLAAGRPAEARARVRSVLARWSQAGFHLPHLYALRIEAHADLYEGDAPGAARRLEAARAALERSVLGQVALPRIDIACVRARVALALAEREPAARPRLLKAAEREARRLRREGRSDATGHAAMLLAGVASLRRRPELCVARLDQAAEAFAEASMVLHGSCAAYVRALAIGGEEGRRAGAQAAAALRAHGVADPAAWTRVQAPGIACP